jgi:DnaD/phage-associated family protein
MKGFLGFPEGKQPHTRLPDLFFSELLPEIEHLGELKVTLHIFFLLARQKGQRPCISGEDLASDQRLLDGLRSPAISGEEALRDALERTVARRTLLRVIVDHESGQRDWYFVNSEKGRQAVDDLLAGKWAPAGAGELISVDLQRPNIFVLYEQNIGPLTPMLGEQLGEAEDTYPPSWIEDAFREAVELNKRSWRYIQRILERWAAEGKEDETSRRDDERDSRWYLKDEWADIVEH